MTAPAPSPAEQAVIERFGIFAEERVIEEVARAIRRAWLRTNPSQDDWDEAVDYTRDVYRRCAAAAVAAYRATQDGGAEA